MNLQELVASRLSAPAGLGEHVCRADVQSLIRAACDAVVANPLAEDIALVATLQARMRPVVVGARTEHRDRLRRRVVVLAVAEAAAVLAGVSDAERRAHWEAMNVRVTESLTTEDT